jgi:hypothetical protein
VGDLFCLSLDDYHVLCLITCLLASDKIEMYDDNEDELKDIERERIRAGR